MTCLNFIKRVFLILICLFSILSCENSKYYKETEYFKNYLKQEFNKEIPESKEHYFIIPNSGCRGCRNILLKFMLSKDFKENCTGIISQPTDEILALIKDRKNILSDKNGVIDNLDLQTAVTVLINTDKKQIINIIPLTGDNLDSLKEYFIK